MGNALKLTVLALGVTGLLACSEESKTRPPIGELEQGINLLDASDSEWGLDAAYVEGDRVIYLETRVGGMKPDVYRQAYPEDPAREMDMLILDQDGLVFWAQRGGDTYIDDTWEQQIADSMFARIDADRRAADFKLAQKAAIALGGVLPAGFQDHGHYLAGYARMTPPAEDPKMQERAARIDAFARPDIGYGDVYYPSAWYETDLYWGKVGCFAWICGYHSATLMWVYTNGWSIGQNACNHGRCQSDGLSYKCYTSSNRWISGGTINGETNRNTTAVSGGCLTPYNWLSGGYDHLCNSDGAYQLWQAKAGSKWTYRGDQYSFTWDDRGNYACNCNNNNDCDGDWKVPNCPPSGP